MNNVNEQCAWLCLHDMSVEQLHAYVIRLSNAGVCGGNTHEIRAHVIQLLMKYRLEGGRILPNVRS